MLILNRLKNRLARFRDDSDGIMTVEMVITLPFLFWMITTSFELYEVHQYKAARVKATYTVADMISREMQEMDENYFDNAKSLFDTMTLDNGDNQVRMSVVRYYSSTDTYGIDLSETRGTGPMNDLTNGDVANAHDELPILRAGEQLIIVESTSTYKPVFEYPGLNNEYTVNTKVFTGVRFPSKLCMVGNCDD